MKTFFIVTDGVAKIVSVPAKFCLYIEPKPTHRMRHCNGFALAHKYWT